MGKNNNLAYVKKYFDFTKYEGKTEIYLVICPNYDNKVFLPISGSIPLIPVITDTSTHSYVLYAKYVVYLKSFNFILRLTSGSDNLFCPKLPFPKDYILNSLTPDESQLLKQYLLSHETNDFGFFQVAQIYEK